ncbi:hypothetical protein H2198_005224 [Neophaeococcomyces mojaviensis]|uniref:Uncharacterized protein n=1 Tax=Neophaeococcomyces mojaviensis TaxID=3383035 RepID=A0ACC3A699_9EURO|nr:hypothetical protein H2198_005224 [Knufia sp. JES_112]
MTFKVLVPVFPGYNTLDLHGPYEVLKNSALPGDIFDIMVASATELTKSCEGARVPRDISFEDVLGNKESGKGLDDFDAVIVPGGRRWAIDAVLESPNGGAGILDLIEKFANLESQGKERWLISVCTGSELMAARGIFAGKTATSHWAALDLLKATGQQYAQEHQVAAIDVQKTRFVDAGKNAKGVRIASSGGVCCGIDCTLWYVSEVVSIEAAKETAHFMDYNWSFVDVPSTMGHILAGEKG